MGQGFGCCKRHRSWEHLGVEDRGWVWVGDTPPQQFTHPPMLGGEGLGGDDCAPPGGLQQLRGTWPLRAA